MPSPTVSAAFLQLTHLGIPWEYPTWQVASGVANGLFPEDPAERPKGWTENDSANVKSLLTRYAALTNDVKRGNFLSDKNAEFLPGRKKWKVWINSIWKSSHSQDKIIAVFTARNCHPYIRFIAAMEEGTSDADPGTMSVSGTSWIYACLDDIAVALFGEECLDQFGYLPNRFRAPTQALGQRTWTSLVRRIDKAVKLLPDLEKNAEQAFDNLDEENVTEEAVATVIQALADWRDAVQVVQSPTYLEKVRSFEAELARLMEALGVELDSAVKKSTKKSKSPPPALFSASNSALASLASDHDIQRVVALYHDYFSLSSNAIDDVPVIQAQPLASSFGESNNNADLGTEYEADKSHTHLANNLGFVAKLPILFNEVRHVAGLTRWTSPEAFKVDSENCYSPEITLTKLHWHQSAAVHAIIRAIFTKKPIPGHCTGMLVADEVGLGKTYQSAAVIAFLADAVTKPKEGLPPAPILRLFPYLRGSKDIPSLPHLILVPGTLLSQWYDELCILFQPEAVDIFMYPISEVDRENFWDEDGPFYLSKQKPSNKIILASHSSLTQEYGLIYTSPKPLPDALPWKIPALRPKAKVDKTLYALEYLSATLDEAHNFRNHGSKHLAALAILQNAIVRLPLTATPLQTSPKDLAAMGRLVGIPHFTTKEAFEEEKQDYRDLRRAKLMVKNAGEATDDPIKQANHQAAKRMQKQCRGHLLRRTRNSLAYNGKELVPLPPCTTIHAYLDLTERELKIIKAKATAMEKIIGTANLSKKIITRGFYIEYRLTLIFARENTKARLPTFKSLKQWDKVKSTKLDATARLCKYFLTRDDLPLPTFANGAISFPPIPPVQQGETVSTDCKIVIFSEFPCMLPLILNVLELYGVKALAVNGTMTFEQRAETIKMFRESSIYKTLILSSAGTVGINLAFCWLMIFLDQPWSAQDVHQTVGRIHRQPQSHEVTCIHLLGNDTSDIILNGMAEGKGDAMAAFLNRDEGKDLFQLLSGGGELETDEDDDISVRQLSSASGSGLQRTKSVRPTAMSKTSQPEYEEGDEDEEAEVAVSIAPSNDQNAPKQKLKKRADVQPPRHPSKVSSKARNSKPIPPTDYDDDGDSDAVSKRQSAKQKASTARGGSGAARSARMPPADVDDSDADAQPQRQRSQNHSEAHTRKSILSMEDNEEDDEDEDEDEDEDAASKRRSATQKASAAKGNSRAASQRQSAKQKPSVDMDDSDAAPRRQPTQRTASAAKGDSRATSQRHSAKRKPSVDVDDSDAAPRRQSMQRTAPVDDEHSDAPSRHRPKKTKVSADVNDSYAAPIRQPTQRTASAAKGDSHAASQRHFAKQRPSADVDNSDTAPRRQSKQKTVSAAEGDLHAASQHKSMTQKPPADVHDSDAHQPYQSTQGKALVDYGDSDSDDASYHRPAKGNVFAEENDSDASPPFQSSKGNVSAEENDSDAPPPFQSTQRKASAAKGDSRVASQRLPLQKKVSADEDDVDAPPPFQSTKGKAPVGRDKLNVQSGRQNLYRQTSRRSSGDEGQYYGLFNPDLEAGQHDSTGSIFGGEGPEYDSELAPADTEISSTMSTRPSSRASDVIMREEHDTSDVFMDDVPEDLEDAAHLSRKRTRVQMATPPSPTVPRGPRRKLSGTFNNDNQMSNVTIEDHEAETTRATSTQRKVLLGLSSRKSSGKKPSASETFALLLGKSGHASKPAAGPSSASKASTSSSNVAAPAHAASSRKLTGDKGGNTPSRSIIPAHRAPILFEDVEPPQPLPAKQSRNPFAPRQDSSKSRR